ncbi:MAG: response regulator [Candidatus Dadabacteria bacterium]|nr:MAG: response regulator [Candidatus Dadabacteria bacterium]
MPKLNRARRQTIRRSLNLLTLGTTALALIIAALATLAFEITTYRRTLLEQFTLLAEVLGDNATAALVFNDPDNAREILQALGAERSVLAAAIFDAEHKPFAHYVVPGVPELTWTDRFDQGAWHDFSWDRLDVAEPIETDGLRVGTIVIRTSLSELYDRIGQFAGILLLIFGAAGLVGYLAALGMRSLLLDPITELVRTANVVAETSDYGHRARRIGQGELALLIDHFNAMLETIEADADLKIAHQKALEATRLKNEFLANMSHELRTPLNAIIGYSEMLEEECREDGNEVYLDDLRRIEESGRHLLRLINDVLDFSKIEARKVELLPEPVDVASVVADVIDTVLPLARKRNNTLRIEDQPDLGTIVTDVTRLRQILFNLLSNACKFTENGTITLRVQREGPQGSERIRFDVIDTGIGIDPDKLERIFRPFEQADASTTRKYGGTGLGLVISSRFAEMMGGSLTVASEPGQGSTFTLRLPSVLVYGPEPTFADDETGSSSGAPVLVVDDDPDARELLTRTLRSAGYTVIPAASAAEALALARGLSPAAITLDLMLPDRSGWDVLTELKSDPATADIPVVVVTMLDEAESGYTLDAIDYLTKPVDREQLLRAIARARRQATDARRDVLIVEDDADVRDLLQRACEKAGYAVRVAADGEAALTAIESAPPALILLDILLPGVDGFGVLEVLERERIEAQVIVITAKDLTAEERDRLNRRAAAVIHKAASGREALLQQVRNRISDILGPAVDGGQS